MVERRVFEDFETGVEYETDGHDEVRYPESVSPGDTVHDEITITETTQENDDWVMVEARVELVTRNDEVTVVDNHRLLVATAANDAYWPSRPYLVDGTRL